MVTLRAFSTQAEAALAKSVLDDHNINSSLADENAYLYGGAPIAMPVRLLVEEDQVELATRILVEGGRDCADAEHPAEEQSFPEEECGQNPWELLAIASLIALPGIVLVLQSHDLILLSPDRSSSFVGGKWRISHRAISVISPGDARVLGAFVIAAALSLVAVFFYLRRRRASR